MALETAGLHGVAHRLFDFALRGDADLLEEFAQAGIENVFVHDDLLIAPDHTLITAPHEPSSFEARTLEVRLGVPSLVIARSQRVPPSAGPMINSATKQSIFFSAEPMDFFPEPVTGPAFPRPG